jgi:hypothetical protein
VKKKDERTMITVFGIGTIVFLMVAATSGCVSENVTATQIKNRTLNSVNNIRSFQFSSTIHLTNTVIGTTGDPEPFEVTGTETGSVDVENRRYTSTYDWETPGVIQSLFYVYYVDGYMYSYSDSKWTKQQWDDPETFWSQYTHLGELVDFLGGSTVTRLPDETVDGVDCYVLQLTPDLHTLYETMSTQSGNAGSSSGDPSDITEWSAKQWITKDTNFLMKSYLYYTMNIEESGQIEGESSVEITTIMFDHNEPVIIELPEDARDAE